MHTTALLSLLSGRQALVAARISRPALDGDGSTASTNAFDDSSYSDFRATEAIRAKREQVSHKMARELLQSPDKVDQRMLATLFALDSKVKQPGNNNDYTTEPKELARPNQVSPTIVQQ